MGNFPRRDIASKIAPRALGLIHQAAVRCTGGSAPLSELLEPRRFLSSTPSRAALGKFDSTLQSTYQQYQHFLSTQPAESAPTKTKTQRAAKAAALTAVSATFQLPDAPANAAVGTVPVETFANPGDLSLLKAAITRLGGRHVTSYGREVDAVLPVAELGTLLKLKSLRFAQQEGASVVDVGPVANYGAIADEASSAATDYDINGAGVKVGIISDSFNNNVNPGITDTYTTDVSSGALPAGVQIVSDDVPGTDEGRAIAQVIYNTAPGVSLAFATGENSPGFVSGATIAMNIANLVNDGCNIIVNDMSSDLDPMFSDGQVAIAAESAITEGVTYIAAAGNLGSNSYASAWRSVSGSPLAAGAIPDDTSAVAAPYFYGGTAFNFNTSGGNNNMASFTLANGAVFKASVQWDSPYASNGGPGTSNQVDAYILNAAGNKVEAGSSSLVTNKDPIQIAYIQNSTGTTQTYNLMLCCSIGSVPGYIKYVDFGGQATNWQFPQGSSTIFGGANASGVESVGAVSYANTPAYGVSPPVLESYSGTGGTPIIFTTNGTRLQNYGYRQSPEIVAPDDVYTTFFGTKIGNNPYPTFTGTSAAAAEVAGLAALLLQKDPQFTPAQVDATLNGYTIKMGNTSPNNQSGFGLVQALPVIANSVGNITGTVYSDNNANGIADPGEPGLANVAVYIDKFNSGYFEPGDPETFSGPNGAFAFYNQSLGSTVVRAITLTNYVPTVSSQRVTVLGATTVSGVYLGMFPTDFVGTNGNYNYTLQVDSQNSADIDIIVGSVNVYIVPLSILTTELTFDLEGGNSTLNVNFANGDPMPEAGIEFTPTGSGNSLIINGSSGADAVAVDGNVTTVDSSPGVETNNNVQSEIINGNGGNDDFTIATPQPNGEALTFNGGLGTTTLNVDSPENPANPDTLVATTFNSGTGSGDVGVLNVSAGIVWTFTGNPAATSSTLTVNDMGNVNISAGSLGSGINTRQLSALNIGPGATVSVAAPPVNNSTGHANHPDRAVLLLSTVSIAPTGILDLNANDLVITNSDLGTISALLSSGYNNGTWKGPGIDSTAAANDTTHLTALGSILNNMNGTRLYSSGATLGKFDGLLNISPNAIIVKYTYYGDTDLSGSIDGTDYSRLDNGYLSHGTLTGWYNGDFNDDGTIDGSDYTLMDNAYNEQGPSL